MKEKFQQLAELGARDFAHVNGTLIEHLEGTSQLLEKWGASAELQDAGLYHAAYGTAGFEETLVSTDQRDQIAAIIGDAAEEIVYQYCACDRKDFFSKIGASSNPEFRNRFTGESYYLAEGMLKDFCELTAANEIEIARSNEYFLKQYGPDLNQLFTKMAPYLTRVARKDVAEVFERR